MTKKQQQQAGVAVENHYHGNTHIAAQSTGNHNTVTGTLNLSLNREDQAIIQAYQAKLMTLMEQLETLNADFKQTRQAYNQLESLYKDLEGLDDSSPQQIQTLQQSIQNTQHDVLALPIVQRLKATKEGEEIISWLIEKSLQVSAILTPLV